MRNELYGFPSSTPQLRRLIETVQFFGGSNLMNQRSKRNPRRRYNRAEQEGFFASFEEESSMEEEWMRDRALLCDLLQEAPDTSPRPLAEAIERSVSWVKNWRIQFADS